MGGLLFFNCFKKDLWGMLSSPSAPFLAATREILLRFLIISQIIYTFAEAPSWSPSHMVKS